MQQHFLAERSIGREGDSLRAEAFALEPEPGVDVRGEFAVAEENDAPAIETLTQAAMFGVACEKAGGKAEADGGVGRKRDLVRVRADQTRRRLAGRLEMRKQVGVRKFERMLPLPVQRLQRTKCAGRNRAEAGGVEVRAVSGPAVLAGAGGGDCIRAGGGSDEYAP